jgi:hypothetical protein
VPSKQTAEANSTRKRRTEPKPGETWYKVCFDAVDNEAFVYQGVFVGKNRSWYSWKNPRTKEEWKENGLHGWEPTVEAAVRYFISIRTWGCLRKDPDYTVDEIISACSLLTEPRRP